MTEITEPAGTGAGSPTRGAAPSGASPSALVGAWLTCCLVWGSTWVVIRVGLDELPPLLGAGLRFLIAAAVLLAIHAWQRRGRLWEGRSWRDQGLLLLLGLTWFAWPYSAVYWAEQYLSSGLTAVLFATFPIFVAVWGRFLLPAERLGWQHLAGILVGFGGVVLLFSDQLLTQHPRAIFAIPMVIGAAFSTAFANVVVKRWAGHLSGAPLMAGGMGYGAVFLLGASLFLERDLPVTFGARAVGSLVYLSLVGSATVFLVYTWLLRKLPVNRASLIAYFVPVVGVAVGALVLDEPVTWRLFAGGLLVLVGTAGTRRWGASPAAR